MEPEEFIRPPEAPVFQPTVEEFKDPIAYISKIRPVVVNTGICKIKPPAGWKPPFALDMDKFIFTPRIQPLNELEAKTRVKLNFLDTLAKFWEMQGMSFKIPNVNRSPLDLHRLYKLVTKVGGFEEVCRTRRWTILAREMGYDNLTVSGSLRMNYEKYLYPYELFQAKNAGLDTSATSGGVPPSRGNPSRQVDSKPRRSRRKRMEDPDYEFDIPEDCPEYKKLAFLSPGPKNAYAPLKRSCRKSGLTSSALFAELKTDGDVFASDVKMEPVENVSAPDNHCQDHTYSVNPATPASTKSAITALPRRNEHDAHRRRNYVQYSCLTCHGDYNDEELLVCEECRACYHTFCLQPPLSSVPQGMWSCPACVAKECCQPQEAFGFEQGKKDYTLHTFGQMANKFKLDYFSMQPKDVPYAAVEKEFWRLVSSIEDEVVVEYGADLHTSKHGSGFPLKKPGIPLRPGSEKYAVSGWNLNNLPNLPSSILSYIDADISGMKVPWVYVGMCFSCFCWHTEDHWSYSINYLHWGEPKTWYGVPSAYAEDLEQTMRQQAPELFENQPDLMHHLSTTLSPTVLMKNGIPVVRTDQCAGEFIVTFPRAYHAGFNQGFNFAEAVNFSLADWLPVGRHSIDHYRTVHKPPVFSHDELICKMVATPDQLELPVLIVAAKDAASMTGTEEKLRRAAIHDGVVCSEREIFELSNDDDRQCCVCRTCCFLSGIRCPCDPQRLSCLHHAHEMCPCPVQQKVLRYRYTLEELTKIMARAQQKAKLFCIWSGTVDKVLDGFVSPKPGLEYLQELLKEGQEKGLTCSEQYSELASAISEAEKVLQAASGLSSGPGSEEKLSVDELRRFLEDIDSLPCVLPEMTSLRDRKKEVEAFQQEASHALSSLSQSGASNGLSLNNIIADLEKLLEKGEGMSVKVPQLSQLRKAIGQVVWVSQTQTKLSEGNLHVEELRNIYKAGSVLQMNKVVEGTVNKVKILLLAAQDWEQRMKAALKEKPPHPIAYFEEMLKKADEIAVQIPSAQVVKEMVQQAKEWTTRAQILESADCHPHYNILKELLVLARPLPIHLELLPQVESHYSAAKAWVDRAARIFLKKNSSCQLLEALLPRVPSTCTVGQSSSNAKTGKKKSENSELSVPSTPLSTLGGNRLKEMEQIHQMEKEEKAYICQMRKANFDKQQKEEQGKGGPSASSSPVLYCLCRRPESGYMLQCEVCNEWYHANCLHIPKSKLNRENDIGKDMRFICGGCLRTRRPRLDSIVSLLIALQKVPVAISEGTALHCVAERAINWQKRSREVLNTTRLIVDEARAQQLRVSDLRKKIKKWKQEIANESHMVQLASQADSVLKHYETQLLKDKSTYSGLGESQRREVEDLLLEGDLLEVTTDETTQLWQVLQSDTECVNYFALSEEAAANYVVKAGLWRKTTVVVEEPDEPQSPPSAARKRKRTDSTSSKNSETPTNNGSASPAMSASTPKKKKAVTVKQQPTKKKGAAVVKTAIRHQNTSRSPSSDGLGCSEQISTEEEEIDDSECSATQCIRPMANEISWVQCDACQNWFHLVCVGLTKESVDKIESYNCFQCKQRAALDKKPSPTVAPPVIARVVNPKAVANMSVSSCDLK